VVVVSGVDGFIGSALACRLRALGVAVTGLGREVDLTQPECTAGLSGVRAIIHLAAHSSVTESYQNPHRYFQDNYLATLNLLELARLQKARFILAGSYVYGNPQYLPVDERHPTAAFNPYAASKLMSEALCSAYHQNFGVPVTILRIFNVFGPGQRGSLLLPTILSGLDAGRVSLGERTPRRDFVYVDDVTDAFVAALKWDGAAYEIFNIGSGRSISVEEVVENIRKFSGNAFEVHYEKPPRPTEIPDVRADIRKAEEVLGWKARVDFETGIQKILDTRKCE